jgi:CxxC motif-containing protein
VSRRHAVLQFVCIACPIGCRLTVETDGREAVSVEGNRCARGEVYGGEEVLAPKRLVTAVVPTGSSVFPCAPVRTDGPVPRALVSGLLSELYGRIALLPVRRGQVLIEDFHGVRVVFTRTLPPDEVPPVGKTGPETKGH